MIGGMNGPSTTKRIRTENNISSDLVKYLGIYDGL